MKKLKYGGADIWLIGTMWMLFSCLSSWIRWQGVKASRGFAGLLHTLVLRSVIIYKGTELAWQSGNSWHGQHGPLYHDRCILSRISEDPGCLVCQGFYSLFPSWAAEIGWEDPADRCQLINFQKKKKRVKNPKCRGTKHEIESEALEPIQK